MLEWFDRIDRWVLERVVQPVVDRYELDPRESGRFMLLGTVIGSLVTALIYVWQDDWFLSAEMLFPLLPSVMLYWLPRNASIAMIPRLLLLSIIIEVTPLDIFLIAEGRPLLGVFALIEHWTLVWAVYLLSCRKPPPRRRTVFAGRLAPARLR